MSVNSHPVRVKTSEGWQELALTGPVGPPGPVGPIGPEGPEGTPMEYVGPYVSGPPYKEGDIVVSDDGIAYICVKPNTTTPPEPWSGIYGPVGPPGPQGPQGPAGIQGPQGSGLPAVQNDKWLTGVGGAAVWSDLPNYPANKVTGLVTADTVWHIIGATGEPAFMAGWSNYGGIWPTLAFRKLASGLVLLRGIVIGPAGSSNPIFTLPVGYRPAGGHGMRFACIANNAIAACNVYSSGLVDCEQGASATYLFVDNIRFLAEA